MIVAAFHALDEQLKFPRHLRAGCLADQEQQHC
jgi:hypothetical protein